MTYGQITKDSLLIKEGVFDNEGYCLPNIGGLGKSKGLEINYRNVFKYAIDTKFINNDTAYSDIINRHRKVEAKAKIPILLRNNFKLILGLNYSAEEFKFREYEIIDNSFYAALNSKPLQTFGATIYATKPFKSNTFITGRASFRLSGDFTQKSLEDYFRISISVLHGWRRNATFAWGFGASYNYTFGKQLIIPVISLSKKLSPRWSFGAMLPISTKLRYSLNEKNSFEFETKISGENYNITLVPISNVNLFIQRSDWLISATYEREIYDFIWIGASVGNRYNITFDLFEKNAFITRSTPFITNQLQNAFFAEVSLFLVPPKKMKEKFKKKGI